MPPSRRLNEDYSKIRLKLKRAASLAVWGTEAWRTNETLQTSTSGATDAADATRAAGSTSTAGSTGPTVDSNDSTERNVLMTPPVPAPQIGSNDFWQKFGETAAMVGLTIGEEAAVVFAQAFVTAFANKLANK